MDILQFLSGLFSKTDNIAILILTSALGVSFYLHLIWRKEEREDRRALLNLLNENTAALNGLKQVLAAMTGKAV